MANKIYRVTAFTNNIKGGNPAGVVLNADSLSYDEMLAIAKQVGYSETAFVMESSLADFKVRFFTPVEEVDLCGHATIATFNLLRDMNLISTGHYTQETKAGILKLEIHNDYIFMEQNTPQYYEEIPITEILPCFKNVAKDYILEMPIQVVSTGLKDIILPIKSLEALLDLEPDSKMIDDLSRKYNSSGIHAFCFDTINGHEAHTRNFAPRYGIDEESATGTANGALSCYLMKYTSHKFDGKFTIEQGYKMMKPSTILTRIELIENKIVKVFVGGSAVII